MIDKVEGKDALKEEWKFTEQTSIKAVTTAGYQLGHILGLQMLFRILSFY